ncbi:Uncharacterised protein [Mycobacteroides abscessus subsp. abscessus]|nr:Uncharacterised protein [Mycobacteroides abscessus subsp. abscessus]
MTPAMVIAPVNPQPSSRATSAPGVALATRSNRPAAHDRRSPVTNSAAVYSRPSSNSSSTTPISPAR